MPLEIFDIATMPYQPAWDRQLEIHTRVLDGELADGAIILVEHPPVVTYGRRIDSQKNLLAPPKLLAAQGVELIETDRGGDITFHGPGQLVAYPIIPLNRYKLNLHSYMRLMEQAVIDSLAVWNINGQRLEGATGVWIDKNSALRGNARRYCGMGVPPMLVSNSGPTKNVRTAQLRHAKFISFENEPAEYGRDAHATIGPDASNENAAPQKCCDPATMSLEKICAMGIKVRKWVTFHGLALNVTTDLKYFDLINPCGLGRPVTSIRKILNENCPAMPDVKVRLVTAFESLLAKAFQLTA